MTSGWPPFFAAVFAIGIAFAGVALLTAGLIEALGGVPDDPLLLGPYITIAAGIAAGAAAVVIGFAPIILFVRSHPIPRPFADASYLAFLGALAALLFTPFKEFAPTGTLIACTMSALGGGVTGLLYWNLVGRPGITSR